ncbi:MAG: hypothetical protein AB8G77_16980 [Rhodothermales bacterium]
MAWQFTSRFRRHAFGWRSDLPIKRIKEALKELKQAARKDPLEAAEGSIKLIEKLSPALEHVDSSSGAIGSAVNKTIQELTNIIKKAQVSEQARQVWMERLWKALQEDQMPYIETLSDYWGELCISPALASSWADQLLPIVQKSWGSSDNSYTLEITPCLSALLSAGRNTEIIELLKHAPFTWWHYRRWGVKALCSLGQSREAIEYAEASLGINDPKSEVAAQCESILLELACFDEAYNRYAHEANQKSTNLATFRAIVKKYPQKSEREILCDLAQREPGLESKWFAAAKSVEQFDLAISWIRQSPTDPKTLSRAARDYALKQPEFALESGLAALSWISQGYGYEITGQDVLETYRSLLSAGEAAGLEESSLKSRVLKLLDSTKSNDQFVEKVLSPYLR